MPSRNSRALILIALVCAIGLGACGAIVLTPPPVPHSIASTAVATTAPVTHETFLDSANLNMRVATLPAQKLVTRAAGFITASTCTVGQPITSGTASFSVDGSARISLSTPTPLWRDLATGDSGPDVSGLQHELARLGYKTSIKGTVDAATLAAVQRLVKSATASLAAATPNGATQVSGPTVAGDAINRSKFVWLPAGAVTPVDCPAPMGQLLNDGEVLATLVQSITSVTVLAMPTTGAVGAHVLMVENKPIAVPESGVISEPAALAAIQASAAYATYLANLPTPGNASAQAVSSPLSFTYQLATPVNVVTVPAAALYGITGSSGCLQGAGNTFAVTIVGSQLGKTFVTLDGGTTIARVSLEPNTAKLCR